MIHKELNPPATRAAHWSSLESLARSSIQSRLRDLFEVEIAEALARSRFARKDSAAPEPGYRNCHGQPRRLSLTSGTITVPRPRVRGLHECFQGRVLPMFARRTEDVAALILELYLHGLALRSLLGESAPLSPASVARLKARWQEEYESWRRVAIADEVVYLWADGIYVKAGLEKEKAALLTVIAGLSDRLVARFRDRASKRVMRVERAEAMIWKLLMIAEKRFRKLDPAHLLVEVATGVGFEDGILQLNHSQAHAA